MDWWNLLTISDKIQLFTVMATTIAVIFSLILGIAGIRNSNKIAKRELSYNYIKEIYNQMNNLTRTDFNTILYTRSINTLTYDEIIKAYTLLLDYTIKMIPLFYDVSTFLSRKKVNKIEDLYMVHLKLVNLANTTEDITQKRKLILEVYNNLKELNYEIEQSIYIELLTRQADINMKNTIFAKIRIKRILAKNQKKIFNEIENFNEIKTIE